MEKKEKFEKYKELRGRVANAIEYPNGLLSVDFIRKKGKEESKMEFSLGPEDFRRLNFKGNLLPGMDIVLWVDEADIIKRMERILH